MVGVLVISTGRDSGEIPRFTRTRGPPLRGVFTQTLEQVQQVRQVLEHPGRAFNLPRPHHGPEQENH